MCPEAFFSALHDDMAAHARGFPGEKYPVVGVDIWNCVVDAAGPRDADYTIIGKPAEGLVKRLFRREK